MQLLFKTLAILMMPLLFLAHCEDPCKNCTVEPQIEFLSVNRTEMPELSIQDTLLITFEFKDGDGNLGRKQQDTAHDIFLIDTRTDFTNTYKFPFITPKSKSKAIAGEVEIMKFGVVCRAQPPGRNFDTVHYELQIRDRSDNYSNVVKTPPIVIKCRD